MNGASSQRPLRVRVGIPHYVREQGGDGQHGSSQPRSRAARAVALSRCLGALLDLQRAPEDCLLHIASRSTGRLLSQSLSTQPLPPLSLQILVCSDGVHQLDEVLEQFSGEIEVRRLLPQEPLQLALDCRDLLLQPEPWEVADLYLYLEDDLVIRDSLHFDKLAGFLECAGHEWVLMPHRYERVHRDGLGVMLVDGPLRRAYQAAVPLPDSLARLRLPGQPEVRLEIPGNPHSGSFCLSERQRQRVLAQPLPRSGFIGPLETAATLIALQHFPVLKPLPQQWRFLCLEHAHRGFHQFRQAAPEFAVLPSGG